MEQETKSLYREIDQIYKSGKKTGEMEKDLLSIVENAIAKSGNNPLFIAGLLNELGGFYRTTANYELSEKIFLQAKELLLQTVGSEHPDTATTLNNLAGVYRLTGEFEKALALFHTAKSIFERRGDTQSFLYGSILNNMGLVHMELKNYEQAAHFMERSIDLIKMEKGPVVYATGLGNLANAYDKMGRTAEAEEMHLKAVSLYRSSGKEENLHFPSALNSLGQFYYKRRDFSEAEKYWTEALCLLERLHGVNHPEYLSVKRSLDGLKLASPIGEASVNKSTSEVTYKKGMDRSFESFIVFSTKVLCTKYKEYMERLTIGLVGEGSECFGYDDVLSLDHDALPEFNLWLSPSDFQKVGEALQTDYENHIRAITNDPNSTIKRGVADITVFLRSYLSDIRLPRTLSEWDALRENDLFILTQGKIFYDPLNRLTTIRSKLDKYYPKDLLLRKLATTCAVMAQTGQYNYPRVLARKDIITANLVLSRFLEASIAAVYLLNKKYRPFYKWSVRRLSELPILGTEVLAIITDLSSQMKTEVTQQRMEALCHVIISELRNQGYSDSADTFLIEHTKSILHRISDPALRSAPIRLDS